MPERFLASQAEEDSRNIGFKLFGALFQTQGQVSLRFWCAV